MIAMTALLVQLLLPSTTTASVAASPAPAAVQVLSDAAKQPEELGEVNWLRNYDQALKQSAKLNKPVLILFQEVPGCGNCKQYGNGVLSEPLMVEAIEDLFVPLAIHNNAKGHDAEVLERFGEPAWNNPVVRIVDEAGDDLADRVANFRSPAQLSAAIVSVLRRSGAEVPHYLRLAHEQHLAEEQATKTATFQTACFWSGEAFFGSRDEVVKTEAGWQDGREVVRVEFREASSEAQQDLANAAEKKGYRAVSNGNFRLDREPKYYLLHSKFASLELSELQASRVNSLLGQGRDPSALLSPRQLRQLQG